MNIGTEMEQWVLRNTSTNNIPILEHEYPQNSVIKFSKKLQVF